MSDVIRPPYDAGLARAVLDGLEDALIALDLEGAVRLVNPAAEEILEVAESTLRARGLAHFGEGGARLVALAARATRERRAVHDDAVAWPHRLGGQRRLEARAAPRMPGGAVEGVTLVLRERAEVFGLVGEIAGDAEPFYRTLAAGIAHEVRNPLGGIRGAVQLLDVDLPSGSPLREHARVALREVTRLASFVERLLDLGRPAVTAPTPLNVHVVLDEAIAVLERDAAFAGVRFERRYDASLPMVRGEPASLSRLFLNLVRNACEAMPGGGRVFLSTGVEAGVRLRAAGGTRGAVVRVRVEDEGGGVPLALVPRLFLPFATGKPGGTGLGLAMARKVAMDHGGWIALGPSSGPGAVMLVYLPALTEPSTPTLSASQQDGAP